MGFVEIVRWGQVRSDWRVVAFLASRATLLYIASAELVPENRNRFGFARADSGGMGADCELLVEMKAQRATDSSPLLFRLTAMV